MNSVEESFGALAQPTACHTAGHRRSNLGARTANWPVSSTGRASNTACSNAKNGPGKAFRKAAPASSWLERLQLPAGAVVRGGSLTGERADPVGQSLRAIGRAARVCHGLWHKAPPELPSSAR